MPKNDTFPADSTAAAEGTVRTDVAFRADDGTVLRGWHYRPRGTAGLAPVVVMLHGFSAVKEMWLDRFAEVFSAAGLGVLLYDNRGLGASDGRVRQEVDPLQQVRDCHDAITFAATLPQADAERIGLWGTSYAGGVSIQVAALDARVRCVAVQVPFVSGAGVWASIPAPQQHQLNEWFAAERAHRAGGGTAMTLPVVAEDPASTPCIMPTADSWQWFTQTARARAPEWRNEVTVRSLELSFGFEPMAYIDRIAPRPLLVIAGEQDALIPLDLVQRAYARAGEPKSWLALRCGHFAPYIEDFAASSAAARDWFTRHLAPKP